MMALGERRFFPEGAPGGKLTVAALASLPLIVYRRWMQPLGDLMRREGLAPDFFCVCDDARTVTSLALRGIGGRGGAGVGGPGGPGGRGPADGD